MSIETFSFPCKKEEYCKIVGDILPHLLARIFRELGFRPLLNARQTNGVDIEAYRDDSLVLVGEILNWSISSRLSNKRKDKIVENLCMHSDSCKRVLFHSVPMSNIDDVFSENNIDLICIGFQILPQDFFNFFLEKDQVIRRRPLNRETKHIVRSKIERYLRLIMLL